MEKIEVEAYQLLKRIKGEKPLVHHLTNWVTIYDCANIVKALGASPVMAHAKEEVAQMASIASALVLNIGTLTVDFVEAMKMAARAANRKIIPVILDICGAGATKLRNDKCFELLEEVKINVIKGNASEIAKIAGEDVITKGVESTKIKKDLVKIAEKLSRQHNCTVVITGKEDVIAGRHKTYVVKNGHELMGRVVGTGCMAASAIGTFCAVEKDLAYAATCGLVCFEIAAEFAAANARGPVSFKDMLLDELFSLEEENIDKMQKVELC
jgi:hydroxyethylthiazole kinase